MRWVLHVGIGKIISQVSPMEWLSCWWQSMPEVDVLGYGHRRNVCSPPPSYREGFASPRYSALLCSLGPGTARADRSSGVLQACMSSCPPPCYYLSVAFTAGKLNISVRKTQSRCMLLGSDAIDSGCQCVNVQADFGKWLSWRCYDVSGHAGNRSDAQSNTGCFSLMTVFLFLFFFQVIAGVVLWDGSEEISHGQSVVYY